MYLGKAVIVSNDASMKIIVEDGINGLFVEKYSPEDISEKIISLLSDRKRLLLWGKMQNLITKKFFYRSILP